MNKLVVSAIGFGGLALLSTGAIAGLKSTNSPVTITTNSDGTRTVNGDLGFVRNTSDTTQHHGCYHRGEATAEFVTCQSRTSGGTSTLCTTSDVRMMRVVAGMDSDSALSYGIAAASSACTSIIVQTRSQAAPKDL